MENQLFQVGEKVIFESKSWPHLRGTICSVLNGEYATGVHFKTFEKTTGWKYWLDIDLPGGAEVVPQSSLRKYIPPTELVNSFSEMMTTYKETAKTALGEKA